MLFARQAVSDPNCFGICVELLTDQHHRYHHGAVRMGCIEGFRIIRIIGIRRKWRMGNMMEVTFYDRERETKEMMDTIAYETATDHCYLTFKHVQKIDS